MEDTVVDIHQFTDTRPFCFKEVDEVIRELGTSGEGLSVEEAEARRADGSRNALQQKDEESLLMRYLEQFKEPLILLLLASAVISILIGQFDDAVSIVLAVIIVSTVGFIQEYRSEKSVEALTQYVAHQCQVLRSGRPVEILAEHLVKGDIVFINTGDRIPADLRLIECIELRIDESLLTGESSPTKKITHRLDEEDQLPVADRTNMAFMGTTVAQGKGRGIVVTTGDDTELGKISQIIRNTSSHKTPLQLKMDQLGKHLTVLSFVIIGIIFLLGFLQGQPLLGMFTVGVSLAVAAIPEGLPIVVTVTLALGVTRMAKRNAIVRRLPAVEALGGVSVICVDKTGTITQNKMSTSKIYTTCTISTSPSNLDGRLEFMNENNARFEPKHDLHLMQLLKIGLLCNNAHLHSDGTLTGNPIEQALLSAAIQGGLSDIRKNYKRLEEIPFDSEKKWMAIKYETENGPKYFVKGALDLLMKKCTKFYDSAQSNLEIHDSFAKLAGTGLRVIACAYGDDLNNLTFVGLVGVSDPPRYGVKEAIRKTIDSGVKVVMITGDSKETAIAVATEVGLYHNYSEALSAQEIERDSEQQLSRKLDRVAVFYRMSPHLKQKIIQAYQIRGDVVAMTGDGVNDAPALKNADIGIAMGKGSDVCKESAKMILVDNNFATIVAAIEEGKCIYANIQNFLRFQLSTSIAALSIMAYCTVFGYPLPLNPMQILWINIIMDGPPAQSLGVEPVTQDVMKNPPRDPKTPVINSKMILKIALGSFIMLVGTLYVFFDALKQGDDIEKEGEEVVENHRATTMAFTVFVMFQMFNALNCRSTTQSVFTIGLWTNKYFLIAIGGSIVMQLFVVQVPFLQYIFETVSLSMIDLVYITIVASTIFIWDEVWKRLKM